MYFNNIINLKFWDIIFTIYFILKILKKIPETSRPNIQPLDNSSQPVLPTYARRPFLHPSFLSLSLYLHWRHQ